MLTVEVLRQLSIANRAMLHATQNRKTRISSRVLSDSQLGLLCQIIHRRHTRQILRRRPKDQRAADHLVACAYVPADGALTFEGPIVPMGDAILLVLHWQASACRLRGYTSWFASHRALTFWDTQRFSFAVDFAQRNCWKALDRFLPTHGLAAARVAMDMEREIHRMSPRMDGIDAAPNLLPTLMAIPRSAEILAEPTPMVVEHASKTGMSWPAAWEQLYASWEVPDNLNPVASSCRLIDTRLCTRARPSEGWPGKVGLYHDLRGFVGRAVPNPARHIGSQEYLPSESLIDLARGRISPDVSLGCTDRDLLTAIADRHLPLSLPGLTKCQVWAPAPFGPRPDAFRFRSITVDADLWTIAA